MKRLLIRLYPARWRARYGDEFEAILDERPIGPFDVADIILGALDARLRLRGRRDATPSTTRGFPMSLRIGGLAAVAFGLLAAVTVLGTTRLLASLDPSLQLIWFSLASLMLLLALIGLSAAQARTHPRLIWAAVAIPAAGAVVTLLGLLGMALFGDGAVIGGISSWYFFIFGVISAFLGSALFAIASYRTGTLSRPGAVLVVIGTSIPLAAAALEAAGLGPVGQLAIAIPMAVATIASFSLGWIVLGLGALRDHRPGLDGPASLTPAG
ncbi:MAG: hypothetical protein ABJC39_02250 [Chloroflexota bacterium]